MKNKQKDRFTSDSRHTNILCGQPMTADNHNLQGTVTVNIYRYESVSIDDLLKSFTSSLNYVLFSLFMMGLKA